MADIRTVAQLLAYQTGRAQPFASHLQLSLQDDALILAFLSMTGEDATLHIAALGGVNGPAQLFFVPDPRDKREQYNMVKRLAQPLLRYFEDCRQRGVFPQLWLSSNSAAEHLSRVGQRMVAPKVQADVQALGRVLAYLYRRFSTGGQQTLISATQALRRHFATGQTPVEDEHLGAFLAWLDPLPPGASILDAVEQAEKHPMGHKTSPDFDQKTLSPLVEAYNKARRNGASLSPHIAAIGQALEPVVLKIYEGIQRGPGPDRSGNRC